MRRVFIILILIVTSYNCSSRLQVERIDVVNFASSELDTSISARVDGLYSLLDSSVMECGDRISEHYTIYSPLLFTSANEVMWSKGGGYTDNKPLHIEHYKNYPNLESFIGEYSIFNDTITAKIPIWLQCGGSRQKIYEAYFQGVFSHPDSIINWHLIAPYPKANERLNDGFQFLKEMHSLHFIESPNLALLDSILSEN